MVYFSFTTKKKKVRVITVDFRLFDVVLPIMGWGEDDDEKEKNEDNDDDEDSIDSAENEDDDDDVSSMMIKSSDTI
jgi:hypothetical protein